MEYGEQNYLDEASSSEEGDEPVIIGFVEKPKNPSSLRRQNFLSKAEDVPSWMDPVRILYATSGRNLYSFCCSEKVLRCSCLGKGSHLTNNGTDINSVSEAHLCCWCGTGRGDKVCGACRSVHYCSRTHQAMHWHSGHKESCLHSPGTSHKVASNTLWPEFEIIMDDESEYDKEVSGGDTNDSSLISKTKMDNHVDSMISNTVDDADKKHMAFFLQRLTKAPEQVLRYYTKTTARPLWPASSGWLPNLNALTCKYCGGPEFQILPQLLYYFGVDNEKDSLGWATIVVYTCEASCEATVAYKKEFAWVQLYS